MDNEGLLNLLKSYEPKMPTLKEAGFRIVFTEDGPELVERNKALAIALGEKALSVVNLDSAPCETSSRLDVFIIDYEEVGGIETSTDDHFGRVRSDLAHKVVDFCLEDLFSEAA